MFISFLFAQSKSPKTISSNLSAISFLHKIQGLPDPTKQFLVQKLVNEAYRLRPHLDLRLPITKPILYALVKALESLLSGYHKTLFQALFLFAFFTYARIGELTVTHKHLPSVVSLKDIVFLSNKKGIREVKVTFRHFKHNLSGFPHFISFKAEGGPFCPVAKLSEYLQLRGPNQGPLFCDRAGCAILRRHFDTELKETLNFCQLSDKCYKGHSHRQGYLRF